jgi:antitoxin ParD1/3/4
MPSTLRITLPEPLREWVERQISRKGYSTASDYVLDLLRHEQLQEARDRVDLKLIEGIESGPAAEMTPQDWQDIRQEGRQRAARQRKKK